MTLTYATSKDYESIAKLEKKYFPFPHTYNQMKEEIFLVAKQQEHIVGYVGLRTVLDEGYISNVLVDEPFRRQHVADALIRRLSDDFRNLSFLTLEVREGNLPAIRLYEKNGFSIEGHIKHYYAKPTEDALIMTKRRNNEDTCI